MTRMLDSKTFTFPPLVSWSGEGVYVPPAGALSQGVPTWYQVGEFGVATSGGLWVAAGAYDRVKGLVDFLDRCEVARPLPAMAAQ